MGNFLYNNFRIVKPQDNESSDGLLIDGICVVIGGASAMSLM
jgi:hypothetical protein